MYGDFMTGIFEFEKEFAKGFLRWSVYSIFANGSQKIYPFLRCQYGRVVKLRIRIIECSRRVRSVKFQPTCRMVIGDEGQLLIKGDLGKRRIEDEGSVNIISCGLGGRPEGRLGLAFCPRKSHC